MIAAVSNSLARMSRMASSSSRTRRSGQNCAPASTMASADAGGGASGPRNVIVARREARSNSTDSVLYSTASAERSRFSGVSAMPLPAAGRDDLAVNSRARFATASSSRELGTTSSTSRQSTARLPLMPSSVVQNTSARSRRTLRLSVTRVSPPVPGNTASSGSSGSETAELPSSTSMIWSVASASS